MVYIALLSSTFVLPAQAPVVDVDYHKHLNLWRAQRSILTAYENIEQAQDIIPNDLSVHALNARNLLLKAAGEIKLAAAEADKH